MQNMRTDLPSYMDELQLPALPPPHALVLEYAYSARAPAEHAPFFRR